MFRFLTLTATAIALISCATPEDLASRSTAATLAVQQDSRPSEAVLQACRERAAEARPKTGAKSDYIWLEYSSAMTSEFSRLMVENGQKDMASKTRVDVFQADANYLIGPKHMYLACLTISEETVEVTLPFVVLKRRNGYGVPKHIYTLLISGTCVHTGGKYNRFLATCQAPEKPGT